MSDVDLRALLPQAGGAGGAPEGEVDLRGLVSAPSQGSFGQEFAKSLKSFDFGEGMLGRFSRGLGQKLRDWSNEGKSLEQLQREGAKFAPMPSRGKAPPFTESVKQLVAAAQQNPGATLGEFIKAAGEDFWMFLVPEFGWETKLGDVAAKIAGRGGRVAANVATGAAKWGTMGAGAEAAAQSLEPGEMDLRAVMNQGGMFAAMGAAGGAMRRGPKAPEVPPPAEAPPPTAPAARAKTDFKATIESTTGVTDAKAARAAREARRAEARAAFKEDPEYADYLRNYAEEEARQRALQTPLGTPGAEPGGPRTPRTGGRDAVPDRELPPANPPSIETGAPSALDSALSKLRANRGFDLTAEERIAVKDTVSKWGRPQLLDAEGKPLKSQGGKADPELLALIAAFGAGTAALLWNYNRSDGARDATLAGAAGLTLAALAAKPATTPLGALLEHGRYTLKTLDRLPQNKFEFTREQILQHLNRPDVTKAEKDVVMGVLGERKSITAKELMMGFKESTGDFELRGKETSEYADYGLEGIERETERSGSQWVPEGSSEVPPPVASARTTIYQSPIELGDANHFGDPNYFAHTRSFDEGGIRHVVEIQSDLAQKAGKGLSEQERALLLEERRAVDSLNDAVQAKRLELSNTGQRNSTQFRDLTDEARRHILRIREIDNQLTESHSDLVRPMLKDWYKRVVREELAKAQETGKPVRFATADTVAKVEGWPTSAQTIKNLREEIATKERLAAEVPGMGYKLEEAEPLRRRLEQLEARGPMLQSEHQSIYDRYKRDIEKFLTKDLGGKPYTDEHGHTWIEVPLPKRSTTGRAAGPTQMFGKADPALLARMAAIGMGAVAGANLSDDKVSGMIIGAFAGGAATRISPARIAETFRKIKAPNDRLSVSGIANTLDTNVRLAAIDAINLQKKVESLVPEEGRRVAISHALEAGTFSGLAPKEIEAAKLIREAFSAIGGQARDAGVLRSFRENYVTHLWDFKPENRSLLDEWLDRPAGGQGMSPRSPYALAREIPTLAEGKARGLKPLSEDISVIYGVYSSSMVRAIENGKFIRALKDAKDATGRPLLMAADKAPHSYESLTHPQLRGLRVHPEVAAQLKFMFDTGPSSAWMQAAHGLNDTLKRLAVSASLFHAKALADALVGGSSKFMGALGDLPSFARGTNSFLKELEKGSASSLVRDAVKSGLMFSVEKAPSAVEDVGQSFYASMQHLQRLADSAVPGSGRVIKGFEQLNHKMDTFMWARLHAGMKLSVWADKTERLLNNSIKAHAKDPNARVLTREEAGAIAASYANDLFGGLNWRRIAMDAETRYGRALAEASFNPSSRRVMQLALFAPDWTISTTRAVLQANISDAVLHPVKGVKGVLNPTTLKDLHRQYILRSALYYFAVGDAINYALSGHHIWQNSDWTTIDMGDGRKMQWSKHTMEPVHWVTKPGQQALNKLGFIPKEAMNQMLGTEYMSPRVDPRTGDVKAGPVMKSGRLAHLAKNLQPIALQQGITGDASSSFSALAGFAGFPIYGMTNEQREEARRRKREEQRK